jgi:hypothetical protein
MGFREVATFDQHVLMLDKNREEIMTLS